MNNTRDYCLSCGKYVNRTAAKQHGCNKIGDAPSKESYTLPPSWVLVVRENLSKYESEVLNGMKAASSRDIHNLLAPRLAREEVEVLIAVCLNGLNAVKHMVELSRGGLHGTSVSCRDILRSVLVAGSSSFILVHNHPSGDPVPSPEDIKMTQKVIEAAEIIGTPLVDHIIIGSTAKYTSMLDLGII